VYVLGFGPGGAFQGTLPKTYQFDSEAAPTDFENYLAGTMENVLVKDRLEPTGGWKRWARSFTLDRKYEALGVIFEFGVSSVESFQGVDNVSVTPAAR
jgi:hypothetical protein